jgi:hypothetical protein
MRGGFPQASAGAGCDDTDIESRGTCNMDVMQKIRRIAIRAAWLVGILIVFTIVINLSWFDEDLHPDLARLVEAEPVSMQDNAYPAVYGFKAGNDRDARAAGLAIVERLRERYRNGERITLTDSEIDEVLGSLPADEAWRDRFSSISCVSRLELDCADRLIADFEAVEQLPPRLRVLLERYETILQTPRFEENQEFDAYTPIPAYDLLMQIARIRLAASYRNQSTGDFLADVGEDVQFWKSMLRDGQSLVAKMVALAGLRNDTGFLSTLMQNRPLSAEQLEQIPRILGPLSEEERDIGETFMAEMRISLRSSKYYAVVMNGPTWINRLVMQENATINEQYLRTFLPLRLRAAMSADEFYRARGHDQLSYEVRVVPPPLYNLGGKLTLKWTASNIGIQDYITRVHDLDGRIALTLLQAEIASNPNRRVEDVVRSSVYRNPFTQEPMSYDPAERTLGFDCLANSDDRCALKIGN